MPLYFICRSCRRSINEMDTQDRDIMKDIIKDKNSSLCMYCKMKNHIIDEIYNNIYNTFPKKFNKLIIIDFVKNIFNESESIVNCDRICYDNYNNLKIKCMNIILKMTNDEILYKLNQIKEIKDKDYKKMSEYYKKQNDEYKKKQEIIQKEKEERKKELEKKKIETKNLEEQLKNKAKLMGEQERKREIQNELDLAKKNYVRITNNIPINNFNDKAIPTTSFIRMKDNEISNMLNKFRK